MPAIQRMVTPIPLTVGTTAFERSLASWRNPSRLGPLGHLISPCTPAGRVGGLVRLPAHPVPQRAIAPAAPTEAVEPPGTAAVPMRAILPASQLTVAPPISTTPAPRDAAQPVASPEPSQDEPAHRAEPEQAPSPTPVRRTPGLGAPLGQLPPTARVQRSISTPPVGPVDGNRQPEESVDGGLRLPAVARGHHQHLTSNPPAPPIQRRTAPAESQHPRPADAPPTAAGRHRPPAQVHRPYEPLPTPTPTTASASVPASTPSIQRAVAVGQHRPNPEPARHQPPRAEPAHGVALRLSTLVGDGPPLAVSQPARVGRPRTAPLDAVAIRPPEPRPHTVQRQHAGREQAAGEDCPRTADPAAVAIAAGVATARPDGSVMFTPPGSMPPDTPPQPSVQRSTATEPPAANPPPSAPAAPAPVPAAAPVPVSARPPRTAAPDPAGGEPNLDDLARQLYERIRVRLKAELRLDRERAGLVTDLPR